MKKVISMNLNKLKKNTKMQSKFYLIKLLWPSLFRSIKLNLGITSYRMLLVHLWNMLTFDLINNVDTKGIVETKKLNFDNDEAQKHAVRYRASPVVCVRRSLQMLKRIHPNIENAIFLDYGSGKGRVMLIAIQEGFTKLIGIELSRELDLICRKNIERFRKKFPEISVFHINEDAKMYEPPKEVCVFFFFKPFDKWTHEKVMDQISLSLRKHPRIIYCLTLQADYDFSNWNLELIAHETGTNIYSNRSMRTL